jgi:hypothetical protein
VEAEIARANAQCRLLDEQKQTDVVSAKLGLERAQLDASARDVVPALENEKNMLVLAKAEQRLRELDIKSASSHTGAEADLAGTIRKSDKAKAESFKADNESTTIDYIEALSTRSFAAVSQIDTH